MAGRPLSRTAVFLSIRSTPLRRVDPTAFIVGLPGALVLFVLFLLPLGGMLIESVSDPKPGFGNYQAFFSSAAYLRAGWTTLLMSFASVIGCVVIGTPVAYALAQAIGGLVVRTTLFLLVASFLVSSLVRAFSWLIILGVRGPLVAVLQFSGVPITTLLFTPQAVLVGMVYFLVPIYILTAYAGFRNIPYNLVAAAEGLGASHAYALATVYLPLAKTAVLNASSLVFVIAVGFFITPALLGGARQIMLAQLIAQEVNYFGDFGLAGAAGFILLVATLLTLAAGHLLVISARSLAKKLGD